jgi:hypothetical protein
MKLWMSGEIGLGTLDTKNWREINIQIEEDLNNYLKSINYSNEKLTEVLLVLIIRNDDFTSTRVVIRVIITKINDNRFYETSIYRVFFAVFVFNFDC